MYEHGNVITSIKQVIISIKQVKLCNHKYKACKAIYKCNIYITYGQIFTSKNFFWYFLCFTIFFVFQAKYRKHTKVFIFFSDLSKYIKQVNF